MPDKYKIELGERLRKLRNELKLEQPDFAKAVGVDSKNTIISWEYGRTSPNDNKLELIERVFHVNPEWLRRGFGKMFTNELLLRSLREQEATIINKSHIHPGITVWAEAGMGGGYFDPDERTEPIERIEPAHLLGPQYRDAFRARGFSMLPVIHPDALCFCDFQDREIRSGLIYAFNLPTTGLVIKELRILKESDMPAKYVIYSYNEIQYAPEYYSRVEIEAENFIVGRIILIHMETNK